MYHDMWITPQSHDEEQQKVLTPPHAAPESAQLEDDVPASDGSLDGIDQVLNLVHPGSAADNESDEEPEITPESLEQEEDE